MMMLLPALHLPMRRKNRPALHLLSRYAPILKPEAPQPQFDLAQFRPRIHQGAQHHVPADARKTVEIGDTRTVHECTAKIIAASRKNDVSLPSKSCQILLLRSPRLNLEIQLIARFLAARRRNILEESVRGFENSPLLRERSEWLERLPRHLSAVSHLYQLRRAPESLGYSLLPTTPVSPDFLRCRGLTQ